MKKEFKVLVILVAGFLILLTFANLTFAYLLCYDYGDCDAQAENTCNSWCNNRGLDCEGWFAYSSWCGSGYCWIVYTIICSDRSWGRWTCAGYDWNCPK